MEAAVWFGRSIVDRLESETPNVGAGMAVEERPSSSVTVRSAVAADAELIADAQVRAWQAAYPGLMPQEYLDGMSVSDAAGSWARLLSRSTEAARVAVVMLGDRVSGFASFGRDRDGDDDVVGELYAINLHPAAWGAGAGRALLSHAQAGLADMGYSNAVLWVVPGNARARRFYEKHGWMAEDVERTAEVMGVTVPEVRYRRSLGGVRAAR